MLGLQCMLYCLKLWEILCYKAKKSDESCVHRLLWCHFSYILVNILGKACLRNTALGNTISSWHCYFFWTSRHHRTFFPLCKRHWVSLIQLPSQNAIDWVTQVTEVLFSHISEGSPVKLRRRLTWFILRLPFGLQLAPFSLCSHVVFPMCVWSLLPLPLVRIAVILDWSHSYGLI